MDTCPHIEHFLLFLKTRGRSPRTIELYRWHLCRMSSWLIREGQWLPTTERSCLLWAASLWECWSPATIRVAMIAASSFLAWAGPRGLCTPDLAGSLHPPPVPSRPQRALTAEEVERIMGACDTAVPRGRRDLAIVALLLDTGLRAAELCRLRLLDLDLEKRVATVIVKGGQGAWAWFGEYTRSCLAGWLADRETIAAPRVETVFISLGGLTPGRPLTARGLRIVLKRLGERAGVAGVSPHAFRRAFATLISEAGASDRMVQALGRWENVRQVKIYTAALRAEKGRRFLPVDRLMGVDVTA